VTASGRVLGLDLGDVRIGVAISDPERRLAVPLERFTWPAPGELKAIASLVGGTTWPWSGRGPRSLSGARGTRSHHAAEFAARSLRSCRFRWSFRTSDCPPSRRSGPFGCRRSRKGSSGSGGSLGGNGESCKPAGRASPRLRQATFGSSGRYARCRGHPRGAPRRAAPDRAPPPQPRRLHPAARLHLLVGGAHTAQPATTRIAGRRARFGPRALHVPSGQTGEEVVQRLADAKVVRCGGLVGRFLCSRTDMVMPYAPVRTTSPPA